MINYEFPLNEKIRRFLRIEEIFSKIDYQQKNRQRFSEYMLFVLLFDLMTSASRSDLKVELLQTLDAAQVKFKNKRQSSKNNGLAKKLSSVKKNLEKSVIQPGFYFGNDRLIQEIKVRNDSPFGIVSTDFPELRYWLEIEFKDLRKKYFYEKFKPFNPIKNAIRLILTIIRNEANFEKVETDQGFYQMKLNPSTKNDLITIQLSSGSKFFPHISSNKYAINMQFNDHKNIKIDKTIKFKLAIS
jgi:cell division protein ZapD